MMKLKYFSPILFLLIIVPGALKAQSNTLLEVTASSNLIDGSHLNPYSNKWKVYAINTNGERQFQTIWTDYVQEIELAGKRLISRTQELYDTNLHLQEVWTNLFEKSSLLPIRASQMRTNDSFLYQEFDGKKVQVKQKAPGAEAVETSYQYSIIPFDWSLYGVLLSGLPLKSGWSGKLPTVDFQNQSANSWLSVSVESKERLITEDGRKFNTFKVSTDRGLTFWLSKKAPYVIQLELTQPNGSRLLWVMY